MGQGEVSYARRNEEALQALQMDFHHPVQEAVHRARRMWLRPGPEVERAFLELVREKILALNHA